MAKEKPQPGVAPPSGGSGESQDQAAGTPALGGVPPSGGSAIPAKANATPPPRSPRPASRTTDDRTVALAEKIYIGLLGKPGKTHQHLAQQALADARDFYSVVDSGPG